MGISFYPPASGGGGKSFIVETITSTGTWTCPADVEQVEVILVGGGGGGTQYTPSNLWVMGGAGGDVMHSHLTVTPGATYTITIGGGGAYYSGNSGSGAPGLASSFDTLLTAGGGSAGSPSGGGQVWKASYGQGSMVLQTLSTSGMSSGMSYSGLYGLGGHGRGSNDSAGTYPAAGSGATDPAISAAANRGGGGGSSKNVSSSNGGSGVCIIKYWSAE